MSCCGNKRSAFAENLASAYPSHAPVTSVKMPEEILFEYTGQVSLTVTGTMSGKRYRFSGQGDIQAIDYRDAGSMMGVPVLKKLG